MSKGLMRKGLMRSMRPPPASIFPLPITKRPLFTSPVILRERRLAARRPVGEGSAAQHHPYLFPSLSGSARSLPRPLLFARAVSATGHSFANSPSAPFPLAVRRPLHNRRSVPRRRALAREILRCAQDDTRKQSTPRVILSESCCSEESRRTLRRPALVTHSFPMSASMKVRVLIPYLPRTPMLRAYKGLLKAREL